MRLATNKIIANLNVRGHVMG